MRNVFIGSTTSSFDGIWDTGFEGYSVISHPMLQRMMHSFSEFVAKCTHKPLTFIFGNGPEVTSSSTALLRLGRAGPWVQTAVVQTTQVVPWLLGLEFMEKFADFSIRFVKNSLMVFAKLFGSQTAHTGQIPQI